MPQKSPTKYPHSASWQQHRNKWESDEYWSKHRRKSDEELRREVEGVHLTLDEYENIKCKICNNGPVDGVIVFRRINGESAGDWFCKKCGEKQ